MHFPRTEAFIERLRATAPTVKESAFLVSFAARSMPEDLRMLLSFWSWHRIDAPLQAGRFTIRPGQPGKMDRIPSSWKHEDYGCDDLVVGDTFEGFELGTIPWKKERRDVYVTASDNYQSIRLYPTVDESYITVAPSLEALLAGG
jgi:hypothetical protein